MDTTEEVTLFTFSILTNITNVKKKSLVVEMIDNPTAICLMERALGEFDVLSKYQKS